MKEAKWKGDREQCLNRSIALPTLRRLRQGAGLTQRELAEMAEVSPNTVYRVECGLRGAYPCTVRKLAVALGVLTEDLVREHRPDQGEVGTP